MNSDSISVPIDALVNLQTALSDCQRQLKKHGKIITGQGETIVNLEKVIVTLREQQRSQHPRVDEQLLANVEAVTRNLQTNVTTELMGNGITDTMKQLLNDLIKIIVNILVYLCRVAFMVKSLGWIVPILVGPIVALVWPNTAVWLMGGLGAMLGSGVIGTVGGVMCPIVISGVIVYYINKK